MPPEIWTLMRNLDGTQDIVPTGAGSLVMSACTGIISYNVQKQVNPADRFPSAITNFSPISVNHA